ncbi:hypothetical protein LJC16_03330, partial [Bacteroidales bacterium OttesenSCG-928-C19]|nr:hypothetical protein [Bacteroidales bacterium OttesenSCG-928-C19]
MTKFTIFIYRFFKKHRGVFYSILLLSTALFAYFGLKVNFEEDISTLLPSAEKGGSEELVFSNLKVKDKIFVLFNSESDTVDADKLIETCDGFIDALYEKDSASNAIHNVLYQVDGSLIFDAISFLYENMPIFLDSSQYPLIDELLSQSHIDEQMAKNYATLRSAEGMMFKDVVTHDPIAIRNVFLSGGFKNPMGGNFTLYEGHLFTPDTLTAIAFISPNFKSFDSKQGVRLAEMIEKEIKIFQEKNPGVEILYHGAPVQSVYNSRQIKKDLILTISISLL